jgi:formylglycine-generating enzyme required for sulfatase activity
VAAYLALFIALGTSGAYAASQIGGKDIKKNAITARHLKAGSVGTKEIRNHAVTARKLAAGAARTRCNDGLAPDDVMVRVGSVCIDRYEASIWDARVGGKQITVDVPIPCSPNGQDCEGKIFARSVPGVRPRARITWFQAQQALANSGKRLPSNAEWQMAAAGTPDGPPCNVNSVRPTSTRERPGCISAHGVYDMVGNYWEWVADWVPRSTGCSPFDTHTGNWPDGFGGDEQCLGGAATEGAPGALVRGGSFATGAEPFDFGSAGPFAIRGVSEPYFVDGVGFRGAR